jgi:Flp pilus assembly CpaE family ATPase
VPLTIVVGRTGQPWEVDLLSEASSAGVQAWQSRAMVDLLVEAEVRAADLIVIGEDFPRLADGLAQLRRLSRVVIVGRSQWADRAPDDVGLVQLQSLLVPAPGGRGHVLTVWGPQGSWGTTSVAIGLARSLAQRDTTLLVDANVHAPSIGDILNVALGGLLQACLAADRGQLQIPSRPVGRLSVLSGVDPSMYPAVHPGALHEVVDLAARTHRFVVLDVDSALDPAGEIGLVPDWTTTAAVGLQAADQVLIVVGESELAHQRLWRALPAVVEVMRGRATVVVNRCGNPRRTTAQLAQRLGDFLPEAALGWISQDITDTSLAPIVAEVTRNVPAGAG